MVFSSALFLFIFLPVAYAVALAARRHIGAQSALLAAVSVLFYAWGNLAYAALLVVSVAVNYRLAAAIDADGANDRRRRALLAVTAILNVGMLCVMKYADFAVANINHIPGVSLPRPGIPLPIGISFFTFQAMSYVIDVYRKKSPAQRDFLRLLLYISFFPQLIAGPIVRYGDIAPALLERRITLSGTAYGLRRFIFGLAKKLLVADVLGEVADKVFDAAASGGVAALPAWIGAVAYAFQIYYDFSGYSDMAIGLGRMLGFDFKENFNYPYVAASLRDFWRRWHISLSTWFLEYVYIPLGGNRRGKARECLNKLAVFFLTGLWHGANWTFVVWGLFHGCFLMLESYGILRPDKLPRALARVYTLLVVTVGFVMFRAGSVTAGLSMIAAMFGGGAPGARLTGALALLTPGVAVTLAAAILAATPLARVVAARFPKAGPAGFAASLPALALCAMRLASSGYNPFIYFRF